MNESARTFFAQMLRSTVAMLADRYRIVRWLVPYVYVSPETEVRTEIDWTKPHRYVVSAPAGTIALTKVFDDTGKSVIDLQVEPVIAFAIDQRPKRTIRIRNQHERDVTPGWLTEDAEPITPIGSPEDDIVAIAYVLPDGSAVCWQRYGGDRYASFDELFGAMHKAVIKAA